MERRVAGLLALLALALLVLGCSEEKPKDLTDRLKEIEEVNQFLLNHPGASFDIDLWGEDELRANTQDIHDRCGGPLRGDAYYVVTTKTKTQQLTVWVDAKTEEKACLTTRAPNEPETVLPTDAPDANAGQADQNALVPDENAPEPPRPPTPQEIAAARAGSVSVAFWVQVFDERTQSFVTDATVHVTHDVNKKEPEVAVSDTDDTGIARFDLPLWSVRDQNLYTDVNLGIASPGHWDYNTTHHLREKSDESAYVLQALTRSVLDPKEAVISNVGKDDPFLSVQITVLDQNTAKPVDRATVVLAYTPNPYNETPLRQTTDLDGLAKFEASLRNATDTQGFSVQISKDGYVSASNEFSGAHGQTVAFDVQLEPTGKAPEPEPVEYQSCADNDFGKNYVQQGTVSGLQADDQTYAFSDTCADQNVLREYFCADNAPQSEEITCTPPQQCQNGRCG